MINSPFGVLEEIQATQIRMNPGLFLTVMLASLGAALLASALYRVFYESRATGSQVHRAFPLLALAMSSIFITVQMSIPLSLGLMGSLSIIRFRTPIKEPEEIGFIMLVIAASLAAATLNFRYIVALFLMAIVSLLLVRGARKWKFLRRDGLLVFTMQDALAVAGYDQVKTNLEAQTGSIRLESSSSRDGITSVQMSFSGLKTDVVALQQNLRATEGVETVNVFLDRPGGIR